MWRSSRPQAAHGAIDARGAHAIRAKLALTDGHDTGRAQLEHELLHAREHEDGTEHVKADEQRGDLLEVLHVAEDPLRRHHDHGDRRDTEDGSGRTGAYERDDQYQHEADEDVDRRT